MIARVLALLWAVLALGCVLDEQGLLESGSRATSGGTGATGGTISSGGGGSSSSSGTGGVTVQPCTTDAYCSAYNVRATCVVGADGKETWVEETCPYGCYAGVCSDGSCADECALGESGARGECRLWDMSSQSF